MSADDSKLPPPSTGKADTSGWVLIMEENLTPSPRKDTEKARRRLSSPTSSPSPFSISSMSTNRSSSSKTSVSSLGDAKHSGAGRPQSRQSADGDGRDSMSTVSTSSSISTPTSRPTSPSFMSTPAMGMRGSALPTLKRTPGPIGASRKSLGASMNAPPSFLHPPNSYREKHTMSFAALADKSLPSTPSSHTIKPRAPSALSQSRIGRPTSVNSGRRSTDPNDPNSVQGRLRSGSTA